MSDTNDIIDCLFHRLRAEIDALKVERDEARREYCEASADLASRPISPEKIADNRGWDCYKEGGGA